MINNKFEEFKMAHSELMKDAIPALEILEKLNDVIMKLEETNDVEMKKKHIDDFYEKIKNWQILISKPQGHYIWMQIPMKYYERTINFSLKDRLSILFKKGVWIKPKVTEKYADMVSNTKFPMQVKLDPIEFILATNNKHDRFYCTIVSLIGKILGIMSDAQSFSVAVYEKPNGVIAMNNVDYWMSQLGKQTGINTNPLRESLQVMNFVDLIKTATLDLTNYENLVHGKKNVEKLIKVEKEFKKSIEMVNA